MNERFFAVLPPRIGTKHLRLFDQFLDFSVLVRFLNELFLQDEATASVTEPYVGIWAENNYFYEALYRMVPSAKTRPVQFIQLILLTIFLSPILVIINFPVNAFIMSPINLECPYELPVKL